MIQQGWFRQTIQKNVPYQHPPLKGKRIVICFAGSTESFFPNYLLLCGKKLSESYADYHDDTNEDVFEDWSENTLSKHRKIDRF